MKKSSVLLSTLILFAACSKVKEIDKRTENMEKATTHVSQATDELKETITIMHEETRSKDAEAIRNETFKILMDNESELGARITAAESYFKSMEFQLMADSKSFNNQDTREQLYLNATKEFTDRLTDLYAKIKVKKMSPINDKNKAEMSFYALSASMHLTHHLQDQNAKANRRESVSFYELMKDALSKDHFGEQLLSHEEVLVSGMNKEMILELIKARVDMTATLGLKNLTDQRNMTIGQRAKRLIFRITGGRLGSIDLPETYAESNDSTKKLTQTYLSDSLEAKNFLAKLQVEKPLEATIKSAFTQIDFNEKGGEENNKDHDQQKEKIRSLINDLLD